MKKLWENLPRPFTVLAPMEDVTDTVFRQIVASCAPPDVFVTEFTSADGLCSRGHDMVAQRLKYTEKERPLVAQIFGNNPETIYQSAQEISSLGFDGIDLNTGCPVRDVTSHGCGAAMIGNIELVSQIVDAMRRGAPNLALSVKTRIGKTRNEADTWIPALLRLGLDALTIHARTAKEMSKVPAHWEEFGKAVAVRDSLGINTKIIGNGDITSYEDVTQMNSQYGVDGVMIGRGIFHNLWVFAHESQSHSNREHLELLLRHVSLFDETWGKTKNFSILKKFFKVYVQGFHNASEFRVSLMETNSPEEVSELVSSYLKELPTR